MIYVRPEGSKIKQGFNFYPLSEWKYSRGFILKIKNTIWMFRYSVKLEKFMYMKATYEPIRN